MPSVSKKQHNLMAMIAHDPAAAKRLGIKQSVGRDFINADRGRKFRAGGLNKGDKLKKFSKGGSGRHGDPKDPDKGDDLGGSGGKRGKPKEAGGGKDVGYKAGGQIKKFAKGGINISPKSLGTVKGLGGMRSGPDMLERQAVRGAGTAMPADMPGSRLYRKGGSVKKMKGGGKVHSRADGIARKGHTKGMVV